MHKPNFFSITRKIYQSSDNGFEVRCVFFDVSKVFDKVWHDGLIFKLSQYTISGNLLQFVKSFLKNHKQRVGLNSQASYRSNILPGASQGSILGLLFFLIYILDLSDDLSSNTKLFVDDTSFFLVVLEKNLTWRLTENMFLAPSMENMFLYSKLNFEEHVRKHEHMSTKVNKAVGSFHKLQKTLPRQSLLTTYKAFIRPHLDYGDAIFDQSYNVSFH